MTVPSFQFIPDSPAMGKPAVGCEYTNMAKKKKKK